MIKKRVYTSLRENLLAGQKDRLYRFLLADGQVRGAVVHGTKMIREMQANHGLGILETLVLGHGYLAGSLLTMGLKGGERINFQIKCEGAIKGLYVESNGYQEVRGFLKNVPIPIHKPVENFAYDHLIQSGVLTVTKILENAKHPFSSQIAIEFGSIAKDVSNYFLTSEQIPTAINLSVQFDINGDVSGAGGLFLQTMPDTKGSIIEALEQSIVSMPSIGQSFEQGVHPKTLIESNFKSYSPVILSERRVEFICHCSKDYIKTTLMMLPIEDLKDIQENGPFPLGVRCHYCNTHHMFDQVELQHIFETRYARN